VVQHDGARGMVRRLNPQAQAERVNPRDVADVRELEPVFTVQLGRLSNFAGA
jgi:hypothetical protein